MTIQQIQYVLALNKHRNFVKAAEACLVTQPTLTMQLKKLETELDFELFDRSKSPVVPTDRGVDFIERAQTLYADYKSLKNYAKTTVDSLEGEFKLGIIPTVAPALLPLFLRHFKQDFRQVHLNVSELQSEALIDMIKKEQLDLGILAGPIDERNVEEIPLYGERFVFYSSVAKAGGVDPKSLNDKELWVLSDGHCFRNQVLSICRSPQREVIDGVNYASGSIETIKHFVRKGIGETIVPELSVVEQDKPFVRQFKEPIPSREICLVYRSTFPRKRLVEELVKSIQHNLPSGTQHKKRLKRIGWR